MNRMHVSRRHSALSRRRTVVTILAGLLSAAGGYGVHRWQATNRNAPGRPARAGDPAVSPVSLTVAPGLRIHGFQTGFVAVKSAHYALRGPAALRLLRIIADHRWTDPLPILAWVIEHPEGVIVVDTGEVGAAADIGAYMAADPGNAWFFRRNLRLLTTPREELAAQMRGIGLNPLAANTVVLTHMHEDHAAGLASFPSARTLVARAEYEGQRRRPLGAVPALWPAGFAPELIEYVGAAVGPFAASHAVTRDGAVVLVPTPGHSYGHQSVLVRCGDRAYLLAGDVAFSETQLLNQGLQGIAQNVGLAAASLNQVRRFVRTHPTVFLPSHDPAALTRLGSSQVVAPDKAGPAHQRS